MIKKNILYGMLFALALLFACAGWHFLYDNTDAYFLAFIAPANESVWEHAKLFFVPVLIFFLVRYLILKNKPNNALLAAAISVVFQIGIMIAISLPFAYFFGDNLVFFIIATYVILFLGLLLSRKIETAQKIQRQAVWGIIILAAMFIVFCLLTLFPPEVYLFYDTANLGYGIM